MPRLPGVRDVTRVSTDGLRLPALDAPAPDPTGEALQGFERSLGQFGEALGEFRKKQQAAEAAAQSSGLQGRVTAARTDFLENDRDDQSDMTGPFEPDRFKRKLLQFDQFTATELDAVRGTSFEAQARQIVQVNRDQFRAKLEIKRFQAKDAEIETVFQNTLSTFGQTVSDDPSMLPVMLETGEDAIRKFGTARGLSEERINRDVAALRSDLSARVLDRGVENGNAPGVLKSLDEKNEITDAIEAPRTRGIRRNAKRQIIRDQGAFKVEEARALDAIVETGEGGTALIERARAVLTDEGEIAGAEARVRVAEAANGFQEDVLFVTPEQMDDALLASFPGDFAGEEDQETFAAFQDVTVRLLGEREADPAGYVTRDRTIATLFDDENGRAEAIALRIQAQFDMGVAPADAGVLTNQEAQVELAKLNPLVGVARAQALLTLKDRYGEHFPAAVNEMLRQGASMGTRPLAEFIDNPAMVQILGDVVGGTQAEFLKTLFPDADRAEKDQILLQASDTLIPILADLRAAGHLNENVDSLTTKRLALKIFAETGDMDQAVRRSIALLNPEGAANIDGDDTEINTPANLGERGTLLGGTGSDTLAGGDGIDTPGQSSSRQRGLDETSLSAANERVEVPFEGALAPQNKSPVSTNKILEFLEGAEEALRRALGPAYDRVAALVKVVDAFSPAADVRDIRDSSSELFEAVKNLDPLKTGEATANLAGSYLAIMLPVSVSGTKKFLSPETGSGSSKATRASSELANREKIFFEDAIANLIETRRSKIPNKKIVFSINDLGDDVSSTNAITGFANALQAGRIPTPGQQSVQLDLGSIDKRAAERIFQKTGLDVSNLKHAIDTGQIAHAFGRHGPGKELDPNQIPISAEALSVYRQVIENPDQIIAPRKKGSGPTITFVKNVQGITVVAQARNSAGTLSFFNMWIKAPKE